MGARMRTSEMACVSRHLLLPALVSAEASQTACLSLWSEGSFVGFALPGVLRGEPSPPQPVSFS